MPERACRVSWAREDEHLGNGWALVDLGDFKSLSRAMPSEVGSIPTHSRHPFAAQECESDGRKRPRKIERVQLRTPSIVVWMIAALLGARLCAAQVAAPDSTVAADTTAVAVPDSMDARTAGSVHPDSLRAFSISDSLGVPGTLKGQTIYNPAEVKEVLTRMGSDEVPGRTTWERKKNPQMAMLCSALFPGLGQTYNGRRLKVGVMLGFASYYMGNMILNWKYYQASVVERDGFVPGSVDYRNADAYASFYKENARTYLWWSGAVWMLGLIDSWIDAHLYDVREYTPPPPPDAVVPSSGGKPVSYLTVGIGLSLKKAP